MIVLHLISSTNHSSLAYLDCKSSSIYPFIYLFIHLFTIHHLSIYLSIHLSLYLSIHPSIDISIYSSILASINTSIYLTVFSSMKAEKVASEIYSALKNGRDSVSPGFFNKVYSHLIVKWLPVPALALLAKVRSSS